MHVEGAVTVVVMRVAMVVVSIVPVAMVVVIVMTHVVVPAPVAVAVVIMLLERAAFPDGPVNHARHVEQPDHAGLPGERIYRAGHRGLHRVADHEYDVGVLQCRGVGGAHGRYAARRCPG